MDSPVIAGVSTNNSTGCMIIPAGDSQNIVVVEEDNLLLVEHPSTNSFIFMMLDQHWKCSGFWRFATGARLI